MATSEKRSIVGVGGHMFGLFERSRLGMHERTLQQAIEDAAKPDAHGTYALAVGQVVPWLAASIVPAR